VKVGEDVAEELVEGAATPTIGCLVFPLQHSFGVALGR
jgi:hypothetical protein